MVSLLKTFGKGILYVLGLPFFILALLIFGVLGIFAFLFQFFKSIIFFFTGQKFFPELPEDQQLRLLKEGPLDDEEEEEDYAPQPQVQPQPQPQPQPAPDPRFIYPFVKDEPMFQEPANEDIPSEDSIQTPIEEACFNQEVEEEEENKPIDDSLNQLIDTSIDKDEEPVVNNDEPEEEEELETYVPRSSNYSASDDDTDDDTGVQIKFDV